MKMGDVKDPEIRLFGKKIVFPENGRFVAVGDLTGGGGGGGGGDDEKSNGSDRDFCLDDKKMRELEGSDDQEKDATGENEATQKDDLAEEVCEDQSGMEELQNSNPQSESDNDLKNPSVDQDSPESIKTENDQTDTTNSEQKPLKKPDKILPCPRCNSMDTKFCYYNNYNVNQPRHFCKSCQRYWTNGGTMRNVPVGAGRRKNKNSALHCRHITISEALQAARIDPPNGYHHPAFKPNGTVLSFGPDSPLCDSMASVLNLAERKVPNGVQNAYYKLDQGVSCGKGGENIDDCSSGSSVTNSSPMIDGKNNGMQEAVVQNIHGFPCFPGVPWPFPWNAAVPLPAVYASAFPFCPPPYWNCGGWSMPWMPPQSLPNQGAPTSSPNSPLGKHSRDGNLLNRSNPDGNNNKESSEHKNSEGFLVVPKTLRIDDPEEAARSPIWSTLGIKYDAVSRGGLFKALQPKGNEKKQMRAASPMLAANPAAMSRSLSFQERA